QVNETPFSDLAAGRTLAARFGAYAGLAVQAFSQNARNRCFTHTTGASKQIRVMQTVMVQRVNQRLQYVLLPYHVAKKSRAPFAGQDLVTHAVVALIEATLTKSCSPENQAAIITASGGNRHKVVVSYPS